MGNCNDQSNGCWVADPSPRKSTVVFGIGKECGSYSEFFGEVGLSKVSFHSPCTKKYPSSVLSSSSFSLPCIYHSIYFLHRRVRICHVILQGRHTPLQLVRAPHTYHPWVFHLPRTFFLEMDVMKGAVVSAGQSMLHQISRFCL